MSVTGGVRISFSAEVAKALGSLELSQRHWSLGGWELAGRKALEGKMKGHLFCFLLFFTASQFYIGSVDIISRLSLV